MSSTRSTTERLAAARPPIVDRLHELVGADERAELLEQILASPVPHTYRGRPRVRRLAAVAMAGVVALGAAILAARTWPGRSTQPGPVMSAALLAHMTSAAGHVHAVVVIDSTSDGVRSTFWALTNGGGPTRMRYSVDGRPSYDQTISNTDGRRTITNVDFAARAWWRVMASPVPGSGCAITLAGRRASAAGTPAVPKGTEHSAGDRASCQVFGPTPKDVVRGLDAGVFRIAGHPVIDGRRTIELTARYPGTSGTYVLFVEAETYLPVRTINSVNSSPFTTTYRYLPATRANLALLQVPIPAGFRHADGPISCNPSQLGPHGSPDGCP